jgi:isopentenyl-diphosphate delta-isomerase
MRAVARRRRRVNLAQSDGPDPSSYSDVRQGNAIMPPGAITAITDGGALYPVDKMDAHRRGVLHMAVSVFIFSGEDLLIQRRAIGKYHSGGQWANSCCTHPYWREPLLQAAERRTREELGVYIALKPAGIITYRASVGSDLVEHEKVQIFHAEADRDSLRLAPDPEEVMEARFASCGALQDAARTNPMDFAPWFRIYLDRWDELCLSRPIAAKV